MKNDETFTLQELKKEIRVYFKPTHYFPNSQSGEKEFNLGN
jgi:hypothetical protein